MTTFEQTVARRVRHLRERQGMTQADLADRLYVLGLAVDRSAIARLESGRRRIGLEEALYLAWALSVAPVHLLVDPDNEDQIAIGGVLHAEETRGRGKPRREPLKIAAGNVRAWIRGNLPIWPQDQRIYLMEAPPSEFGARVQQHMPVSEEGQAWMQLDANQAQKLAGLRALEQGTIERGNRSAQQQEEAQQSERRP